VTNAPLLEFSIEGRQPGDELRLPAAGKVKARVAVRSAVPLDHVEVVGNGKVVATVDLEGDGTRAEATVDLPAERSGWYVLRAWADRPLLPVLDLYPFGSTSPVYVKVADRPLDSRQDAAYFVRWVDRVAAAAGAQTGWNTPAERAMVLTQLARARAVYDGMAH
jgi:TolB protein